MDLKLVCQEPDKESDILSREIIIQQLKSPLQKMKKQKNGITLPYLNRHHQDSKKDKDQMKWHIK